MPKINNIFVPRKPDFMKPASAKDRQGFDKSKKYEGKVLKDDAKHRLGGHYRTTGGVLTYLSNKSSDSKSFFKNLFGSSSSQQTIKERFVQPAPIEDYFTYYCYEIYQYCGVNTPKYRYGTKVASEQQAYGSNPTTTSQDFAHISTLIPADKIPIRDVVFQGDPAETSKLSLKNDQYMKKLKSNSNTTPGKISGNLFGAHLVGFLLQNTDMGGLNGYFVERQNRQHHIVIDMNKVMFAQDQNSPASFEFNRTDGKAFDHLATDDQRLAVISRVDRLLKGDLEKIYYSPRAIEMAFELQPQLARKFLDYVVNSSYRPNVASKQTDFDNKMNPLFDEFQKEVEALMKTLPHTRAGVEQLFQKIRELAAKYESRIAALPNAKKYETHPQYNLVIDPGKDFKEALIKPKFSPDLQIQEIRKNGQAMIEHYAPNPQTLRDFDKREQERAIIADTVVRDLKIDPPEDEVIKDYIIEDLRGKYYDTYKNDKPRLIEQLKKDFSQELGIAPAPKFK